MTSGSQMLGERTRLSADIYLNTVNAAVAHIRDWKVDHTITSQERKCAYGTVGLHTLYMYVSSGKITIPNALLILFFPFTRFAMSSICSLSALPTLEFFPMCTPSATMTLCTTAPSSTTAPGMITLSITLAPVPTFVSVNNTEFSTVPSMIQPW